MSRKRTLKKIVTSEYITIGELARISDTRYSTLKFYTEEGLLPFEQQEQKLTRRYHRENSQKILAKLKKLKNEGLSIAEIKKKLKGQS